MVGPENSCYSSKDKTQSSFQFGYPLTITLLTFLPFWFFFSLFAGIHFCFLLQYNNKILRMRIKDRRDTILPTPDGSRAKNKPVSKHIPSEKVWKVLGGVKHH